MAETIFEFFDRVTDRAEAKPSTEPSYNRYGDCIHYHWRQDEFYAERVDDKLTVYRAIATEDPVGCQIKGVSALVKMLGTFGISVKGQDGTPMAIFIFASRAAADSVEQSSLEREKMYRYVLEQAGKAKVELEQMAEI